MERMTTDIWAYMDSLAGTLADVNRFIYEHPETALEEKKSASTLIDVLERYGFSVQTPAAGMETAFVATVSSGSQSPHIAFVAQYDALRDLGHACGHNLCATASLGAALGVAKFLSRLNGRVSVIGTPSEEVLASSGKLKMIAEGLFQDVDAAMATHPHSRTWLAERFLAINQISVRFMGKSTHAGDTPHLGVGVNAYDAVQLTFVGLSFLRQQLRQDARVHWGEVDIRGPMNVIPEKASAKIGLRASDDAYTEELTRKAVNCIQGAALMTGCEASYEIIQGYRSFRVNPALVDAFRSNLKKVDMPEDDPPEFGRGGSTDMGNISQVVPAIYPLFKITENDPPHSSAFCSASGTDGAHAADLMKIVPGINQVFVCPICLNVYFSESIEQNQVDVGHVWPEYFRKRSDIASHQQVLLCKKCNSDAGQAGDAMMQVAQKIYEGKETGNLGIRKINITKSSTIGETLTLDAYVLKTGEKSVRLGFPKYKKRSQKRYFGEQRKKFRQYASEGLINMMVFPPGAKPSKPFGDPNNACLAQAGFLTSAYLFAFFRYGYTYILQTCLNPIRDYIQQSFIKNVDDRLSFEASKDICVWRCPEPTHFRSNPEIGFVISVDENTPLCQEIWFLENHIRLPVSPIFVEENRQELIAQFHELRGEEPESIELVQAMVFSNMFVSSLDHPIISQLSKST